MSDPSYLPPQYESDSPDNNNQDTNRERSLTPFLRSQGRAEGHGLVFNSRISPSPNRSIHRRRKHRQHRTNSINSDSSEMEGTLKRRNLTREIEQMDEVDRYNLNPKESFKNFSKSEQSNKKRISKSVINDGRKQKRVTNLESVTVSRKETIRIGDRRQVTSDYSSQSDGEQHIITSTPKNTWKPITGGSPRLRAFDGDGWIWSPRTSYTYANSLTYRDKITPGREIPMPHMARLPLGSYTPVMEHTELWELSEIARVGDYSDGECDPASPHLIYRRRVDKADGSWLSKAIYFILLPIMWILYLLKKIFYEYPVDVIRMSTSHLLFIHIKETVTVFWKKCFSILQEFCTVPFRIIGNMNISSVSVHEQQNGDYYDENLTEDEDDVNGLNAFLTNQKLQQSSSSYNDSQTLIQSNLWGSFIKYCHNILTAVSNFIHISLLSNIWRQIHSNGEDSTAQSFLSKVKNRFSFKLGRSMNSKSPKKVVFKDIPEMPKVGAIDPYISEDEMNISEEISENVHYVGGNGELLLNSSNNPADNNCNDRQGNHRRYDTSYGLISILLYPLTFICLISQSSANYVSDSFNKIFFKSERICSPKKREKIKKMKQMSWREWFLSFLYRKKPIRRSRRLQGLDPEEAALMEKRRQSRRKNLAHHEDTTEKYNSDNTEEMTSADLGDDNDEEETELVFISYCRNIRQYIENLFSKDYYDDSNSELSEEIVFKTNDAKTKDKRKRNNFFTSGLSWISSLFYKKQVRRSRRLIGLEPENSGILQQKNSRKKKNFATDDNDDDDVESMVSSEDEEYYELYVKVWFQSFKEYLLSSVPNSDEHTESKANVTSIIKHKSSWTSSILISWLFSLFLTSKQKGSVAAKNLQKTNEEIGHKQKQKENDQSSDTSSLEIKEMGDISELRIYHLWRLIAEFLKSKFNRKKEVSLSTQNLKLHNLEMRSSENDNKSDKSDVAIENWLKAQSSDKNISKNMDSSEEVSNGNLVKRDKESMWMILYNLLLSSLTFKRLSEIATAENESSMPSNHGSYSKRYFSSSKPKRRKKWWLLLLIITLLPLLYLLCSHHQESCQRIGNKTVSSLQFFKNKTISFYTSTTGAFQDIGEYSQIQLQKLWGELYSSGEGMIELMKSGVSSILCTTNAALIWSGESIWSLVSSFVNITLEIPKTLWFHLSSLFGYFWSNLSYLQATLWSHVTSLPQIIPSNLVTNLCSSTSETLEALKNIMSQFISFQFNSIQECIASMIDGVKTMFASIQSFITSTTYKIGINLSNTVSDTVSNVDLLSPFKGLWSACQQSTAFILHCSYSLCEYIAVVSQELLMKCHDLTSFLFGNLYSTFINCISTLITVLSTLTASFSTNVSKAWNEAFIFPSKHMDNPEAINYDLIVQKILNDVNFQSSISNFANAKVENERFLLEEKLKEISNTNNDQIQAEVKSYMKTIENLKAEVDDEIRLKITEIINANNVVANQQTNKQNDYIQKLEEKYNEIIHLSTSLESHKAETDMKSQKSEAALLEEILKLRNDIDNLLAHQKTLNDTLLSCCKNQTFIELTVDKYISEMLKGVEADNSQSHLTSWISSLFIAKSELQDKIEQLSISLEGKLKNSIDVEMKILATQQAEQTAQLVMDKVATSIQAEYQKKMNETKENGSDPMNCLSREDVMLIVKNALIQYDADKTGMFDYALETAGGSVISTRCTETYVQKTAMYSIFGIPIWYPSNNPRTVIQPGVQPGECWAFKGSTGFIVIRLSDAVRPTRFSMEHISKSMSPSGKIDSAPKDFVVYGLKSEKDTNPIRLGTYTYDQDVDPLQYFDVMTSNTEVFSFIELDIMSNHGNINYTCLYRFRVHGVQP